MSHNGDPRLATRQVNGHYRKQVMGVVRLPEAPGLAVSRADENMTMTS